jgi:hypothetical protein
VAFCGKIDDDIDVVLFEYVPNGVAVANIAFDKEAAFVVHIGGDGA